MRKEKSRSKPLGPDLFSYARAQGLILENQLLGLGKTVIPPGGSWGELSTNVDRNLWARRLHLTCEDPGRVIVKTATVGGLPLGLGEHGVDLTYFTGTPEALGGPLALRPLLLGQRVHIVLQNTSERTLTVSGAIYADEINPAMTQKLWENILGDAAVNFYGDDDEDDDYEDDDDGDYDYEDDDEDDIEDPEDLEGEDAEDDDGGDSEDPDENK